MMVKHQHFYFHYIFFVQNAAAKESKLHSFGKYFKPSSRFHAMYLFVTYACPTFSVFCRLGFYLLVHSQKFATNDRQLSAQ